MYNETCSINHISVEKAFDVPTACLRGYRHIYCHSNLTSNATPEDPNNTHHISSPYLLRRPNFSAFFAFLLFDPMESNLSGIIITVVLISVVIIPAVITLIYRLLKHRRLNRAPPLRPMPPSPPWSGIYLPRRPVTPVPHDNYAHASRAHSPVSSLGKGPEAPLGERNVSTSASLQEGRAQERQGIYASIELARVPRVRSEGDEAQNVEFERRVDGSNGSKRIFS